MLLDDLLTHERAMRRLATLFRRRRKGNGLSEEHESFLDEAALHRDLAARLARHGQAEGREPGRAVR